MAQVIKRTIETAETEQVSRGEACAEEINLFWGRVDLGMRAAYLSGVIS